MFGKKNKINSNSTNIPNSSQDTTSKNIQADQQKQNKKQNKIPLRIVIGIIVIIIIGIVLFSSSKGPQTIITTTIPTTTTTIATNAINTTTISNTTTTTIATNAINTTTIPTTTTTINMNLQICSLFSFSTNKFNSTITQKCRWNGGMLGIWGGSGNSNYLNVEVTANNKTYLNKTYVNNCLDFLTNISLPANNYNLIIKTGPKNGTCGDSILVLNKTILPIYQNVYNGNFSKGYSGWNISGKGFGIAPLNINSANAKLCYLGTPWTNYNNSFFATTFRCGLSNVFGNITSSYFKVTKAFLNFKIISPQNKGLYIEILYKHKPYITIQYNTFNNSIGSDSSSTFRNATIPLETILNKVVQIKVIAGTLKDQTYIAIGNFKLSNMPNQQIGIISNETINSSVIKS